MPAYSFEALDDQGATRKGVMEADTAKAVRGLLRAQALVPLQVQPVGAMLEAAGAPRWMLRRVFGATALAVWTRQLAGLVASGLPLERALSALAEEAGDARERALVAALRAEVNGGAPFAQALARFPRDFPDVYIAVVGAGEQSGQLGTVLERLADDLEARQALRARLVGAALYPAIVTVVAIVIVVFLVSYVVPQVANVFAGTKRALPFLTSAMLAISAAVRDWGWLAAGVLAAAVVALRVALRKPAMRERFDGDLNLHRGLPRQRREFARAVALRAHTAARLFDKAIHHRHAEPAPRAELLGGEEGFEDPRQGAAVHPHAIVADGNLHVVAGRHFKVGGGGQIEVVCGKIAPRSNRIAICRDSSRTCDVG